MLEICSTLSGEVDSRTRCINNCPYKYIQVSLDVYWEIKILLAGIFFYSLRLRPTVDFLTRAV
jgi:hypothetical protein